MSLTFSHCPADHRQNDGKNGCEGCPALPGTEHCEAVFIAEPRPAPTEKHRVTNFGSQPLVIILAGASVERHLQPGEVFTGVIGQIIHGPGRSHYSVRPAERAAAPDPFLTDDGEE